MTAFTPREIRAELGHILTSDGFARCGRMRRFLEFIVEETLAGRAAQLAEYAIGVAVFDRGEDFEPALDPIVRNDARRLRMKLLEFYKAPRLAASPRIDVPKGGYVPVFLSHPAPQPPAARPRVAVLPFDAASPEASAFSRALCLSLTANLTNIEGVDAVAHGYRGVALTHAVEGAVLDFQGRRRVIVNLVQVADGAQLWAREYEVESGDPFQIARTLRNAVLERLGMRQPRPVLVAKAA